MTQVQRGEKTNNRGDLDTEVIRTFDKEVNSTDNFIFCPDPCTLKSMRVEVKITTPGSQAACSRLYRRIDDDYQDN